MADEEFEESTAIYTSEEISQAAVEGSQKRHVLVRMDSADVGKVITLTRREYTIGRRSTSDILIDQEGVSRNHAGLSYAEGRYYVEDLGSANGTTVSGQTVQQKRALADGDLIQLGPRVTLRYSVTDSGEEKLLRHLYEASVRDSLTGCYNREYLDEQLKSELAYCRRHNAAGSLIMLDLDKFKQINDTYGHRAGDAVLITVAHNVQQSLRKEDVFARYGGEEFAICLRGVDLAGAALLAERLRVMNDTTIHFEGRDIPVSISFGCAAIAELKEPSAEGLIAQADQRLYQAKRAGRNRVVSTG